MKQGKCLFRTNRKYFIPFFFLCLTFVVFFSCKDDEDMSPWAGYASGDECGRGFVVIDGNCQCPENDYWQIGLPPEEAGALDRGSCFIKSDSSYFVTTNCPCNDFFDGGSFVMIGVPYLDGRKYSRLEFYDSTRYFVTSRTPDTVYSSNVSYYLFKSDGDEFGFNFVNPGIPNICHPDENLLYADVRGKFSTDYSTAEAEMVWYTINSDSNRVPYDTCYWHLTNH